MSATVINSMTPLEYAQREGCTLLEATHQFIVDSLCASANEEEAGRESALFDERFMKDPRRMNRAECLGQVLLYYARAGEMPGWDEERVRFEADAMDDAAIREWAVDVAREHPWPAGFKIPTFAEFVKSPEYLDEAELTPHQEWAITTALGADAYAWFVQPRKINTVVLMWGKGSGKDLTCAESLAYTAWTVGHMRNPWFHFNHPTGEPLDCLNVAENAEQAKTIFFQKLSRMVGMPCFADILDQRPKKDILTESVNFWRKVPGRTLPVLGIRILSLHSQNEGAEGKNTFFYCMDEADAMEDSKGHENARKMHRTLSTSNRFGRQQIGVIISYPRARIGFMYEMLARCSNIMDPNSGKYGEYDTYWGDKATTTTVIPWKSHVKVTWQGREYEPDSEMETWHRSNIEEFRAMYECEPLAVEGAFFSMPHLIRKCVAKWLTPIAITEPSYTRVPVNGQTVTRVAAVIRDIRMRAGVMYHLFGDAGEKHDSFALCLMHCKPAVEAGSICPLCWRDWTLRNLRHYEPVPVPKKGDAFDAWRAAERPCDHCGGVAELGKQAFWGMCRGGGRFVPRERFSGRYTDSGIAIPEMEMTQIGTRSDGSAIMDLKPVFDKVWLPEVVEDLLIEIVPNEGQGWPVDFGCVRDITIMLGKTGQLDGAKFDRWQSTLLIQEIQNAGIACEAKNFSNPEQLGMYRNLKSLVYEGLIQFLPEEKVPCARNARSQLEQVQLVNNNKIDHPKVGEGGLPGKKDLTDAEAGAAQMCCEYAASPTFIDLGGREQSLLQSGMWQESIRLAHLAGRANPIAPSPVNEALRSLGIE